MALRLLSILLLDGVVLMKNRKWWTYWLQLRTQPGIPGGAEQPPGWGVEGGADSLTIRSMPSPTALAAEGGEDSVIVRS